MKTLATLHAKELYDVIRFPADTSRTLTAGDGSPS